ncbi:fructuronate reductase [Shigella flexneri]|nr:fructuronate reductase [Shigella flexneri]EKE5343302.1 fructuronate reductase [Shigella flexneri]
MTTIVDSNLPVARPSWDHSRLESRIVHLGCGAFHRAHQALYTHHLLESTDSDWGICEVNLMPGNDRVLIENLKKQQLLYTVAPTAPKSAIGYIVEALRLRREKGLKAFTVMSCDNVRENGHVAKVAVLGLAQARDPQLAAWIEENVTFPCTMVDRIVPAATPETLQEIADQLGVYDPCAIACEPFRQWVIEDNFVNGRPDWDKVGAQFVADVVPFEMMKLRMLNGSHSFLAYLGYLGGYETIADTMTNPDYRKAAFALMMQEQAPTLSMPEGTDLKAYATLLIERFSNPSLRHRTWQIAMDGSQKLPQRLLDPVRLHLQNGGSWRHLALGVAGWMRYTQGVDEQGNAIDVVDPMLAEFQKINAQYQGADRVKALLGLSGIFADDLPQNADFVGAVTAAYQQLCERGARECVAAL